MWVFKFFEKGRERKVNKSVHREIQKMLNVNRGEGLYEGLRFAHGDDIYPS